MQIEGPFHANLRVVNSGPNRGFYFGYSAAEAGSGVIASNAGPLIFWTFDGASWGERGRFTGAQFSLAPGQGFAINTVQVVGARRGGWSAASGTATRTSFDTSSVTTVQLAERVKALIDDLIGHGLIGA